jgi:hypothetical protein
MFHGLAEPRSILFERVAAASEPALPTSGTGMKPILLTFVFLAATFGSSSTAWGDHFSFRWLSTADADSQASIAGSPRGDQGIRGGGPVASPA